MSFVTYRIQSPVDYPLRVWTGFNRTGGIAGKPRFLKYAVTQHKPIGNGVFLVTSTQEVKDLIAVDPDFEILGV